MAFMTDLRLVRCKAALILVFCLFAASATAGTVTYAVSPGEIVFTASFERGYSGVDAIRTNKEIIISFETTEDIQFDKQVFFDLPLKSSWMTADGTRKRLYFTFDGDVFEPVVNKQPKMITITFSAPSILPDAGTSAPVPTPLPGMSAYVRMLLGIVGVVGFILIAYALMKTFFRNSIVSDIPGSGRMLGKVDLELKKSLIFYELGESIYIMGLTDSNISLVDKITDPVEANRIKAGFSKRKDFSSYMKFFRKTNEIKTDMEDSSAIIEEKLKSIRKK